jgi:signal transduction histidine kinase/DNA-binding response OmpR family regulator
LLANKRLYNYYLQQFIIVAFFTVFAFPIDAQYNKKIQQIKTDLLTEGNSTKIADLYNELSSLQLLSHPEESRTNALQSLSISKSVHYVKGSIQAHHQLARYYIWAKQYDEAEKNMVTANETCKTYNNNKDLVRGLLILSEIHWLQNKTDKSQQYLEQAETINEKLKLANLSIAINQSYGHFNRHQNKNHLALQYFIIAYEKSVNEMDAYGQASSAKYIAENYLLLKNQEKALNYFEIAIDQFTVLKMTKELSEVHYEVGNLQLLNNDSKNALENFKKCLDYALESGYELYIKLGYQSLSETYEKTENYKEAYEYLKFYSAIKDTREITELEAQLAYEKQSKEFELVSKENALQREQIETERYYRKIGILVIVIILTLILFLWRSLRQRERANKNLKIATDLALQSKKEKEEFFAYTSHEIRTPLNAVVGTSKLLGETDLSELQQKYVKTITSSAQNILFLVNDVLDISKIEKGELKFENIPVNLREICDQIVQSLSFKKFEKEVDITCQVSQDIPEFIMGDPVRINQILLNLADNALKFTHRGAVHLSLDCIKGSNPDNVLAITFTIKDTGIGIAKDKINHIFDSYQQAHLSTTRQFGGTGLGLSISKLLVEKMGGKLQVSSKEGVGSEFFFTLDVVPCDCPFETESDGLKPKKLSILIVDDNPLNLEIFRDLLHNSVNQINVTTAHGGKEALQKLDNSDFDLILMDLQMPELDGYETTQLIRSLSDEKKQCIPIIALTAHVLEGVHEKCLASGMNDTLSKPINLQHLYTKICSLLPHKCPDGQAKLSQNPSSSTHTKVRINLDTLNELTGNKPERISKYLATISENLPQDLEALKLAVIQLELEEIGRIAHKIKGSLVYLGNTSLLEEIHFFENLPKERIDKNEIKKTFAYIEQEIILILTQVKNVLTPN